MTDDGALYRVRKPASLKELVESGAIARCRRFSVCTEPASVWASLLPRFDLEVRPASTSSTVVLKLAGDTQGESRRWLEAIATVAENRRKVAAHHNDVSARSPALALPVDSDRCDSPPSRSKPEHEDPIFTVDEGYAGSDDECGDTVTPSIPEDMPNWGSFLSADDSLSTFAGASSLDMAFSGCGSLASTMEGDPT